MLKGQELAHVHTLAKSHQQCYKETVLRKERAIRDQISLQIALPFE